MNIKIEKIYTITFWIISLLIIIYAVYIRGYYYLKDIPFWGDDMLLAESICEQDIWKSFTHIFGTQKAPPLFIFFTYINTVLFGFKEWVLRLIPFISGIISVVFFYILSLRVFKSRIPVIAALMMFALNDKLIYYVQEFKQYSSDVLICILVLLCYKYIDIEHFNLKNYKTIILYSIMVFLIMISSFPAVFAICAVLTLKIIEQKKFPKGLLIVGTSIISACIYIIYLFKHILAYEITIPIWTKGFLNFSIEGIYNVFENFMEYNNWGNGIYILCFFIGMTICAIEKSRDSKLIFLFFLYACIGSLFHVYPISERAALYFLPILIIFIAKTLEIGDFENRIIKIFSFVKSIILIYFIISNLIMFDLSKEENVITFENYSKRTDCKYDYSNFLKEYKQNDILIANIEFNSWLLFYNKALNYNYDFKTIINQLGDGTSYEQFLENTKQLIIKRDKTKNTYLAFTFYEDEDNTIKEKDIENILKKQKIKYKKIQCKLERNKIFMIKRQKTGIC